MGYDSRCIQMPADDCQMIGSGVSSYGAYSLQEYSERFGTPKAPQSETSPLWMSDIEYLDYLKPRYQ